MNFEPPACDNVTLSDEHPFIDIVQYNHYICAILLYTDLCDLGKNTTVVLHDQQKTKYPSN